MPTGGEDVARHDAMRTRISLHLTPCTIACHNEPVSRVVASLVALWLVVGGALAARHTAQVAHVVDQRSGLVLHASHLTGHHATDETDIHGQADPKADHDVCGLLASLAQPAHPSAPVLAALPVGPSAVSTTPGVSAIAAAAVYRIAPKTSPPLA